MLQAIYHLSQIHPYQYWSAILVLLLVVIRGWYRLGSLNALAVPPAPQSAPVRPRWIFYRRSTAIVLQIANLLILGSISANNTTIAATIAVRVT
jgi:hypothetical protein